MDDGVQRVMQVRLPGTGHAAMLQFADSGSLGCVVFALYRFDERSSRFLTRPVGKPTEPTDDPGKAWVVARGSVKFDGCTNWDLVHSHTCDGLAGLRSLTAALLATYHACERVIEERNGTNEGGGRRSMAHAMTTEEMVAYLSGLLQATSLDGTAASVEVARNAHAVWSVRYRDQWLGNGGDLRAVLLRVIAVAEHRATQCRERCAAALEGRELPPYTDPEEMPE